MPQARTAYLPSRHFHKTGFVFQVSTRADVLAYLDFRTFNTDLMTDDGSWRGNPHVQNIGCGRAFLRGDMIILRDLCMVHDTMRQLPQMSGLLLIIHVATNRT